MARAFIDYEANDSITPESHCAVCELVSSIRAPDGGRSRCVMWRTVLGTSLDSVIGKVGSFWQQFGGAESLIYLFLSPAHA